MANKKLFSTRLDPQLLAEIEDIGKNKTATIEHLLKVGLGQKKESQDRDQGVKVALAELAEQIKNQGQVLSELKSEIADVKNRQHAQAEDGEITKGVLINEIEKLPTKENMKAFANILEKLPKKTDFVMLNDNVLNAKEEIDDIKELLESKKRWFK